jgi:uncharacterized FlaG/YvyC family protein
MNDFKKLKMVKKLSELKENGIIDDAEFEIRRENILHKKLFWTRKKIIIIVSVLVILVVTIIISSLMYHDYIQKEDRVRATQSAAVAAAQKRKQEEAQQLKSEQDNYKKINDEFLSLSDTIDQELKDFNDSALGEMKYINMPDHSKDWVQQLDEIKSNLYKLKGYTDQLQFAPDGVQSVLQITKKGYALGYESEFNDYVILIKYYNNQITDYNNWAQNYISTGGKADYLDPYTASDFTAEIDYDKDGKKTADYTEPTS